MEQTPQPAPIIHLIQLAGGKGLRAGGGPGAAPKQFRPTGRGLLFTVSLRAFLEGGREHGYRVGSVTVVVPDDWRETALDALTGLMAGQGGTPWTLAPAGSSRTASTWNALSVMAGGDAGLPEIGDRDLVAIHDAARPFATAALLGRLIKAAAGAGCAVPGVPVIDTVVQAAEASGRVRVRYLPRETLSAVQTPQVCRWDLALAAHRWAAGNGAEFTDDGGLLADRGHPPVVVPGEQGNWKVTTEEQWQRARDILT